VRHLVVDITGHGFGHAGQVAPVVAALHRRAPTLTVTIRTDLPPTQRGQLFADAVRTAPPAPDFGLAMKGPLEIDREASRERYAGLHQEWNRLIEAEAAKLEALAPDLVVSDVGYVGLAAAQAIGVPTIALSSLNWADVLEAYDLLPQDEIRRIRTIYRACRLFIQAAPHMPMAWLNNRVPVGPMARMGRARGPALRARLGLDAGTRLGLVSLGGIPAGRLLQRLPTVDGLVWLADRLEAEGVMTTAGLDMPFIDLLASVDLIVGKTGYGLFVEPAAHGLPVLYLARPDWPEAPYSEAWIEQVRIGRPLPDDPQAAERAVRAVLAGPRPAPVPPTGGEAAAALIAEHLGIP